MDKSFKARLEALEALEAAQEAQEGRRLELWLSMRPAEYFTLFEDDDATVEARDQVLCAYGFDQLLPFDRVHVLGGVFPVAHTGTGDTIARRVDADNFGYHLALAPWVDLPCGETRVNLTLSDDVEALRLAYRTRLLADLIRRLDVGDLLVRPFRPDRDLRQNGKQLSHCVQLPDMVSIDRWCERLRNTLDWHQLRTGAPFAQTSDAAAAILRALKPGDMWTSHAAVWPQRDKLARTK